MNKKVALGFFVAITVMVIVSACGGSDPESDFKAEPIDGGKSVLIAEYVGTKWDVRIPSKIRKLPVTHIGRRAFFGKNLTSIIIPNSVTTIEVDAFANNQLTKVTIPNSVTFLAGFSGNQLTSVTIPNSVIEIGAGAFSDNQLANITIPNSVTTIGSQAFMNNQLTNVNIPNSVTSIGMRAFDGNPIDFEFFVNDKKLMITNYKGTSKNLIIPETIFGLPVNEIAGETFNAWKTKIELTGVTIPDSVTWIGGYAFTNNHLTSITIGANVRLDSYAFADWFRDDNFYNIYNNNGKQAGTYTRPDTTSSRTWKKQ